jgi:hypothetical protein
VRGDSVTLNLLLMCARADAQRAAAVGGAAGHAEAAEAYSEALQARRRSAHPARPACARSAGSPEAGPYILRRVARQALERFAPRARDSMTYAGVAETAGAAGLPGESVRVLATARADGAAPRETGLVVR